MLRVQQTVCQTDAAAATGSNMRNHTRHGLILYVCTVYLQVELELDDIDKNGIALGKVFVGPANRKPGTSRGAPFAVSVLRFGLAKLDR